MPIYEYRCDACGTVFEEWHKHADDIVEQPCPACATSAHRLISNTSFVLKGGGWYVTEYGNRKAADSTSGAATPATPDKSPAPEAPTGSSDSASTPKAESAAATTPGAGAKPAASAAAD